MISFQDDYIALVLYPELFISWLGMVRNCDHEVGREQRGRGDGSGWLQEADRFFQTVGQDVSKKDQDQKSPWLQLYYV